MFGSMVALIGVIWLVHVVAAQQFDHVQPTTAETSPAPTAPLPVSIQHACAGLDQPFVSSLAGFWRIFLVRAVQHMQFADNASNISNSPETKFGIARYNQQLLPNWIELVHTQTHCLVHLLSGIVLFLFSSL
jgi:hypothetical protein